MTAVDDKRSQQEEAQAADPWSSWSPQWTGEKHTPHDIQEKHSPTQQVVVRLAAQRLLHQSQRRIVDARLWEAMTFIQQDAAIEIATAFEMMGRGMGYAANNWQRIPGCRSASNVAEAHALLINFYIEWAKACTKRKISHAMVIDVLCFGFTCRMIDHDRRLKTGGTKENLLKGLTLYCQMKGW